MTQGGQSKRTRIDTHVDGLDFLRLVLALTVVIFHYVNELPRNAPVLELEAAPRILIFGRYAVDAFFIISGMVIARSARYRSFPDYAVNRMVRLQPAIIICATITLLVTHLIVSPGLPSGPGKLRYVSSVLTLPLIADDNIGADWSYWSLTYELRFYLLAGLFFMFFRSARAMLIGVGAWMALTTAAYVLHNPVLEVLTVSRAAPCFMLGILFYLYEAEPKYRRAIVALGIAAMILMPVQMMVGVALGQTVNPITWPEAVAASLVVVSVVLAFNAIRSFGSLRGLARTAGAVSYPLYLLHQLAGYVLIAQFMWLGAPPWAAIGLAIAIVVSVAYLVAVFAEPWLAKRLRWILNAGVDWLRKLRRKVVATT